MKIDDKTISHLENLTMLRIEDKESLKVKLGEVLTFMENLSVVKKVEKSLEGETIYREDKQLKKTDLKDFFDNNPKVVNHSFEVPKIL